MEIQALDWLENIHSGQKYRVDSVSSRGVFVDAKGALRRIPAADLEHWKLIKHRVTRVDTIQTMDAIARQRLALKS